MENGTPSTGIDSLKQWLNGKGTFAAVEFIEQNSITRVHEFFAGVESVIYAQRAPHLPWRASRRQGLVWLESMHVEAYGGTVPFVWDYNDVTTTYQKWLYLHGWAKLAKAIEEEMKTCSK